MKRLQRADQRLGALLSGLFQPSRWWRAVRAREAGEPRAVLLIKFWSIGSMQLLTPAVRALRRRHPAARLVLLTLRENEAFARVLAAFDEVVTLDVRAGA